MLKHWLVVSRLLFGMVVTLVCIPLALSRAIAYPELGSYTALAPYARERYFENHKMLSAVDKLHKLYSATAEPIVWARSVGLEVLNELDTIKIAFMMSAGRTCRTDPASIGWNVAASGLETVARGVSGAKNVGETIAGLANASVRGLLKQLSNTGRP